MTRDSDGIDITLAKPKSEAESKTDALPVEPQGKYEHTAGGNVELGRGGMGRVLAFEDVHLKRQVAVKELLTEHHPVTSTHGAAFANLFVREAQVLARLEHPGVVPIYELARRPDGTPYYAMRKIRGQPLTRAIEACASLEDRLTLLPHLVDVAHTIGFAHSQGVVHRDLKPDNVMVGPFGETLVVDWGLAQVEGDRDPEGQIAGTPAYMSPEQVNGRRVDARSDVWSMGVILYELLAGVPLFSASTVTELLEQVKRAEVPPILKHQPRLTRPLVAVVSKALAREPNDRFQNGEELALALERAVRARTPRPVTLPILLVAVVLAFAIVWWRSRVELGALEARRATLELAATDAARARGQQLAAAAVRALRSNDGFEADRLARAAEADGPVPLARGVRMITHEQGVPRLVWKVPIEAGCARVAVTSSLVACSTLNGVELFEAGSGASKGRLSAGPAAGWLQAIAVLSDEVVLAGADNRSLYRWQLSKPATPETITFPESITALSPGAGGVLVGLRDGSLFKQPRVGERVALPGAPSRIKALVGGVGRYALGADALLRLSRLDGEQVVQLDRTTLALDLGPKDVLYAGVERAVIRIEDGPITHVFSGHRDTVTAVAAGQRLASGDAEGSVRIWFDDGSTQLEWRAFEPGVQALTWTDDGGLLIVAPRGRALEAWSVPEPLRKLPDDGVPTVQAWWRRGWLLTGLRDGRIRKIDAATLAIDYLESKHEGAVRALAEVSSAGRPGDLRHLSGGDDGRVLGQRWNGEVEVLDTSRSRVTALDVAPDGSRAAWAFDDGTVVLWALPEQKEVRRLREAPVRSIRFSPDSLRLALGRDDKRVVIADAQDGKEQRRLEETDAAVLSLVWAGEAVAVGLANGRVQVWSVAEGRAVRTFTEPSDRAVSLALSPDDSTLAAGSDDGHVYVWELSTAQLVADVPADAGEVRSVSFVGNDRLFAAGTDGRVHAWSLAPP
ncbi:MAG: protein kinase [Myxococcaceae bacterium]|nr:protein kinase [Myxococcaceae bacterium]